MALITCPECRKKISDTTDACPNCGYKLTPDILAGVKKKEQQSTKTLGIGCVVVIAILAVLCIIGSFSSGSEKNKVETREERIEEQFSGWDGSHRGVTALIKEQMNDPGSYEHVETVYWDEGDHLVVKTTFRGKNAFGGVVTNWVMAEVDLNGNVTEVVSWGP